MLKCQKEIRDKRGACDLVFYFIALLTVVLDQISKWIVLNKMDLYQSIPIIEGWFHFTSTRNQGAAFSILQGQRWFFIVLTLFVVAFISYYLYRIHKTQKLFSFSLALILGGAIGNLIDRSRFGEVVDFIDVRIINFAVFNIADSAIVIGVILMLWDIFINKNESFLS